MRLCEACAIGASRRNVGSGDFLKDKAILLAALIARSPASLLLVVAIVAPEARGFVSSHGHCVVSQFVKRLKGSAGDDDVGIEHEADYLAALVNACVGPLLLEEPPHARDFEDARPVHAAKTRE
jgi:hypothetical protein